MRPTKSQHGQWSSNWIFILAATGAAVGLGNIWKFPYIAGENGGGAFVLVYLFCIAAIGIPIMMAEIMLGRRGRQNPVTSIKTLAAEENKSGLWRFLGWSGVVAGFLILSYYSVIAGQALAYIPRTFGGMFDGATADGVHSLYQAFTNDPERLLAWHTIFMVCTMVVVARGVKSGLERAVKFLMPALFLILLLLVAYASSTGEYFQQAIHFLFNPDFSKLSGESVLIAMGHAFFTLSLGMGTIMIYGAYLPKETSILKVSIAISVVDTVVALLAGLAIFPLVFANNLEIGSGPGLIFETLPIAFGHMDNGAFLGGLFFLLLVLAAWSSAISMIEPAITWVVEKKKVSRVYASVVLGVSTWLLGILTILSFNIHADWYLFDTDFFRDKNFYGLLDYVTSNIMLPLGGLFIAIFAGWVMHKHTTHDELGIKSKAIYGLWRFLVRWVTPIAVIIVFLNAIGLMDIIAAWLHY